MRKNAQLTIFMGIGLIIMLALVLLSYSGSDPGSSGASPGVDAAGIRGFVESCMSRVGEWAVYDVALQGGYYAAPELSAPFFYMDIPYYWHNETSFVPSGQEIEKQLALYVFDALNSSCLDDFAPFREQGYSVTGARLDNPSEISAAIVRGGVDFSLAHPFRFSRGESSISVDSFHAVVPLDIGKARDLGGMFIEEQRKHPNEIPLSAFAVLANSNNFTFGITYLSEDEIIYSLNFDVPHKEPLTYAFVGRYDWSDLRDG